MAKPRESIGPGGAFWHITSRKSFKPSASFRPVSRGGWDVSRVPALYVTRNPHYWHEIAGGWSGNPYASGRKWAAEIEALEGHPPFPGRGGSGAFPTRSDVPLEKYYEDLILPETILDPRFVKVVRIIPIEEAIAETTGYLGSRYIGQNYRYQGPDFPGRESRVVTAKDVTGRRGR